MPPIHYAKPSITELEIRYATDAAANGWGERCNVYIQRFETAFREHLGMRYAVATSSCTGALHLGLAALGIGPGDEIILGDINWIASAAPITYLGATPVLVDVLAHSWCLDPERVEAAITPRTKAIMAVHIYGNMCDMNALLALGKKYNLPVIEDAAEAIGSRWQGKRAGTMGTFGTFSFHGTKTFSTGEGGMFVTDDAGLYETVLALNHHGRMPGQPKNFWPEMIGFKYRMSNVQAAIGCAQIERSEELIASKRRIFSYYKQQLHGMPLTMNAEPEGTTNGYWMPTIMVDEHINFDRDALLSLFKAEQIDAREFFWPLSMLPMFERKLHHTVSYRLHSRAINLPGYYDMSETDLNRVVTVIKKFFSGYRP